MSDPRPVPPLEDDETLLAELRPDRARYWRDHVVLAMLGAVAVSLVLWIMGSAHVAIGALGAILALAVRGLYMASEQLRYVWRLTDRRLILPDGRGVMLLDIETVRRLLGDVQLITRAGDKHLIRHMADGQTMVTLIERARDRRVRRQRR